MIELIVAREVHVLGAVVSISGVAMVTTVLRLATRRPEVLTAFDSLGSTPHLRAPRATRVKRQVVSALAVIVRAGRWSS